MEKTGLEYYREAAALIAAACGPDHDEQVPAVLDLAMEMARVDDERG